MKIFISYRREDTLAIAGRIYDRLRHHFGPGTIFMDLDAIPIGEDFREVIQDAICEADVMLALIGPGWLGPAESGDRRANSRDYVRAEIEAALDLQIPVIPVLLDGAAMPSEDALPSTIARLSFRNALTVDSGKDFDVHVDRLLTAAGNLARKNKATASPYRSRAKWKFAFALVVCFCLCLTAAIVGSFFPGMFRGGTPQIAQENEDRDEGKKSDNAHVEVKNKKDSPNRDVTTDNDDKKPEKISDKAVSKPDPAPTNPLDELTVEVIAKQDELGNILVSTVLPNSKATKVSIARNGKEIVVTVRIVANNLYNGAEVTLRVSSQRVEDLSAHNKLEDIRIDPRQLASAKLQIAKILRLSN